MYTLDQYRDMVKKSYLSCFSERLYPDAERYFESEEAQQEIENRYKRDIARLERQEITEKVFCNGCVSSVAYCLYLMME